MARRVLIADDAAFMREMLRDILGHAGFEVCAEAADGNEAVACFEEHAPDLVTLDIVMPRKSGLEALREIIARDPGACVVMCSALGQEALVMEALESGAKDFVVKPFKADHVVEVLNKALDKTRELRRGGLDLEKYRSLFVNEASDHLVEMGRALLALEGGAEGPAADEAVDTLFRMAHSIKGMAASLEYDSAAALAHALEDCLEPLRRGGGMDAVVLQLATEAIRALDEMVATVEATGAAPLPRTQLVDWLRDPSSAQAQPLASASPPRPASSRAVRVRTELIDRFLASIGELLQRRERLEELHRYAPRWEGRHALAEELDRMDHVVRELRRRALDIRTTSVQRLTERLPMVASDLARALDKRVRFEISGDEVEVDRAILDHLDDSLLHMVRNAVDHGIEPPAEREAAGKDPVGTLRIRAWLEAGRLRLRLSDDGRGIDVETLRRKAVERGLLMQMVAEDLPPERVFDFVFEPGMSTAEKVTDISGRGVGMDAVKRAVEALGGTIELQSSPGAGTSIELDLPSMVALQRVLLAQVGGERVALPLAPLEAVLSAEEARVEREDGVDAFFLYKDEPLPLLDLGQQIGLPRVENAHTGNVLVLEVRGFKLGLHVERAVGNLEVYVRDVPPPLDAIAVLGGVAILPDGSPVFLLELGVVVERFLWSASLDKYAELTSICAGNAANALAQLLGTTLRMGTPRGWVLHDGRLPAELFSKDERVTAVLAELEGAVAGPAGLILRRDVLEYVLQRLIGDARVNTLSERALSALCELGNIAVSAAANALSELVGGVVLPSVPRLGFEKPAVGVLAEVCGDLSGCSAYLVEVELFAGGAALRLLFVWIPEA